MISIIHLIWTKIDVTRASVVYARQKFISYLICMLVEIPHTRVVFVTCAQIMCVRVHSRVRG